MGTRLWIKSVSSGVAVAAAIACVGLASGNRDAREVSDVVADRITGSSAVACTDKPQIDNSDGCTAVLCPSDNASAAAGFAKFTLTPGVDCDGCAGTHDWYKRCAGTESQ